MVTTSSLLSGDRLLVHYWKPSCVPLPSGTMQFSSRRKKYNTNSQTELYLHPLQFYGQPPLENISLSEFEAFAVDRLKCKSWVSSQCNDILVMKFALSSLVFAVVKYICNVFFLKGLIFTMSSFNAIAVLKTIENLGVSYVKLSEQYTKKLESESKALNFLYRPDAVSMFSSTHIRVFKCNIHCLLWVTVVKHHP